MSCAGSCSSFPKSSTFGQQQGDGGHSTASLPPCRHGPHEVSPLPRTTRPCHPPFLMARVERNTATERKWRKCFSPAHHLAAFENERPASFLSWGTTRRAIALHCCRQICFCALQPGGTALAGRRSWRSASEVGRGERASKWQRNLPGLRHVP